MTGWFMPRLPNRILYVRAPDASASSWLPRQMPKTGVTARRPDSDSVEAERERAAPAAAAGAGSLADAVGDVTDVGSSKAGAMKRRNVAMVAAHIDGSPGPLEMNSPSIGVVCCRGKSTRRYAGGARGARWRLRDSGCATAAVRQRLRLTLSKS